MGQQENPWLGEKIDGYHIRHHVIGEGGMGAVYRAHHEEMGRTAAAKFLPLPCSDEMAKRFVREAQAHQRLENIPYVGRLHHFVTRHDGKPCYVLFLELFDKPAITLDEYVFIHSDRLTHPDFQMRLGEMYMKIAFALGQAQQLKDKNGNTAAVIHRDLKPGNIMILNPQQRELEPRVIDWGLARIKPVAELTSSSAGMGTPAYMSPEQLHTPDDVDFRSDIYSLGLVIFKTRTGEHFCPDIEENDEGHVIAAKAARFMHDSGRVRERLRTLPLPERVCLEPMLQTNRNKRPDGWWEVVGLLRGMYQYHSLRKDGETYHHGAFEKVHSSDIESAVSVDSKAEEGTVKKDYRKKLVAIAASVLLLLCSGGVALYFAYYLDPLRPEMKVARVKAEAVDASVTKPVQPRFKTEVKIEKKKPPPDPFRRESEWCKKHHKKRDSFSSTPTLHAWCVRNRAVKLRRKGVKEDDPEKIKEALEIIKKVRKKFCTWRNLRYDENIRPYCKEKFWDDIRRSRKMLKKKKRDLSLP
jgi:serine/threonine protein kinase